MDGHLDRQGLGEQEFFLSSSAKTRYVVYGPPRPATFNGTVLLSWNNVAAEGDTLDVGRILDGGFGYVAAWFPSDERSFDTFTQIARVVGPLRPQHSEWTVQPTTQPDPLGGLDVRNVVGVGSSHAAVRLVDYINAVQVSERAFAGFLLSSLPDGAAIRDDVDVPVSVVDGRPTADHYRQLQEWVTTGTPPPSQPHNRANLR